MIQSFEETKDPAGTGVTLPVYREWVSGPTRVPVSSGLCGSLSLGDLF